MTAKENQQRLLKIMQFGGGNFLRAFSLWMIDILNEEEAFNAGVVVIKPTAFGNYNLLREQSGNYYVLLNGLNKGQTVHTLRKIECIEDIVNPYKEWQKYLKLAENSSILFVISNTTEAGIKFSKKDTISDQPPKEFPAKLALWLYHRFKFFKGDSSKGCLILPCELIEQNGEQLRKCILAYAGQWELEEEFTSWVLNHNYFYNTLVDRIVSGFPTAIAPKVYKEIGYHDPLLVAGEYYHSWIINGPEIFKKEWPLHNKSLNIQMVEDLDPYRKMKVRLLNGAHTTLVPLGLLLKISTVREAIEDVDLSRFLNKLLENEIIPSLKGAGEEGVLYIADVMERFRNPSIRHQLSSISLNSIAKFRTRLLPSLLNYVALKRSIPPLLVFVWAALIIFYRGSYRGEAVDLKDDEAIIAYFKSLWDLNDPEKISRTVLSNSQLWGDDFSKEESLVTLLSYYIKAIDEKGIKMTMNSLT
ncbi:MAG: tagaturonate reductase [Eudoraea sp.]|uniref:tagaturonate reductase n=1 Tax=Eudoraea sp. TaxID=1979955 RepID=UPI003C751AFE